MICKKVRTGIGAMTRIKLFVPSNSIEKVYERPVEPYFDYWFPLWDNCEKLLKNKLWRFQSRAAKVQVIACKF